MALVGSMTIEELALFYFEKKSSEISPYFEIEQINIVAPYHTSQQPRFGHKHLLPSKFFFRLLSQNIPKSSKRHRAQIYALGSCKVLILATIHNFQSEGIDKISSTWLKQIFLLFKKR
jgi:hypothetical protein